MNILNYSEDLSDLIDDWQNGDISDASFVEIAKTKARKMNALLETLENRIFNID